MSWKPRERISGLCRLITVWLSGAAVCVFAGCGNGALATRSEEGDRIAHEEPGVAVPEEGRLRVAGIVLKWVTANRELNYQRGERLIREAASKGARLVVTTECFLDGYAVRDMTIPVDEWRALGEPIPGGVYLGKLQALAEELDIHLVAGMLERDGRRTYNAAVVIAPDGRLLGKYRKQKLGQELVRIFPGDESPVFDTAHGKLGLMIGADRRYPELARRLVEGGADILICLSGGMYGPLRNDYYLQARSRENQVPVIFVHPIEFLVTGPDGAILDRRLMGEQLDIAEDAVGTDGDASAVALYDLELRAAPGRSRAE